MNIISIVITLYFVFLYTMQIEYKNANNFYKISYNGLLWVLLDIFIICRSNSAPKKWIDFTIDIK